MGYRAPTPAASTNIPAEAASSNDLIGWVNSYNEHWQKAVKALGDPNMATTINGWLRRLKDFAEQIHAECVDIQNSGGRVTSSGNSTDVWTRERVEKRFSERMTDITKLKGENDEVARKNGIQLAAPW